MRPALLVDTAAFVARYHPNDPTGEPVRAFLESQDQAPTYARWLTVVPVVAETYTLLRREAGLVTARQFLQDLARPTSPRVMSIPWDGVADFLQVQPPSRLGWGFSFADATLVVAAQALRRAHILTLNHRDFRPFGVPCVPS